MGGGGGGEKMGMQLLITLNQQLLKREEHTENELQNVARLCAFPEQHVLWPLLEMDTGSDRPLVWPSGAFLCSYLWHQCSHLYL